MFTSSLPTSALRPLCVWKAAMSRLVIKSITRTALVTNFKIKKLKINRKENLSNKQNRNSKIQKIKYKLKILVYINISFNNKTI